MFFLDFVCENIITEEHNEIIEPTISSSSLIELINKKEQSKVSFFFNFFFF